MKKFENALILYRKWYLKDVEKFGEDYWKNKLLVEHGSLDKQDMTWAEVYEDVQEFHVFDEITAIDLARLIV